MKKIKLIIVDDHEIYIAGLRLKLLTYADSIEVIAEASDDVQLMNCLDNGIIPDVILMDYHLQGLDGIRISRNLKNREKYTNIKIIILSAYSSQFLNAHNFNLIIEAIDAGIEGYLLKDSKIEDIIAAVLNVMNGVTFILGETIDIREINKEIIDDRRRLINLLKKYNNFGLTGKEIEILQLFAQGESAKTIAGILGVSEECITNHKDNIKQKLKEKYGLGFKNVVELIVWSIKNKIVNI